MSAAPPPDPTQPPGSSDPVPPVSPTRRITTREITIAARAEPLARTDAARTAQAKEVAEELGFRARRFLSDQWDDLRAADVYFKLKLGIIAAWVAISIVSIGIGTSTGGARPSANSLDAYVKVQHTSMGWALLVENRSKDDWNEVKITLDDAFIYRTRRIAGGLKSVLSPSQFLNGTRPMPRDVDPGSVSLEAKQGSVRIDLNER